MRKCSRDYQVMLKIIFCRFSQVISSTFEYLCMIKRQIYFELEIRCQQLQKNVGKKRSKAVREQFEIDNLLPEQENTLRKFLGGQNIFVNLPLGYGKSLIFQCLPIAADALFEKPCGFSVLIVILPLRSLMEDQIRHVNNMGVPAITITDKDYVEIIQQVMNSNYVLVYGSPECLLSTESWRSIFHCQSFKEMLIGVAIDEAHCITQWYV